jgi:two-component sensor histidine kinase
MAAGTAAAGPAEPAPRIPRRPPGWRWVLAFAALCGAAVSAWIGVATYRDTVKLEQLRFDAAVDQHAAALRAHVAARETLARAVAAAFAPPERVAPGALAAVDPELLALVPDIFSFVWVPRLDAARAPEAMAALAAAGRSPAAILGPGGTPLAEAPDGPLLPVLDIEPKTEANLRSLGLHLGALPLPRTALRAAEVLRDASATAPLELVQLPGQKALVLYVPVFRHDARAAAPVGFLGFSYRFDRLIGAVQVPRPAADFVFTVSDATATESGVLFRGGPPVSGGATVAPLVHQVAFGGREWHVEYRLVGDPGPAALRRALLTAAAALLVTGLALAIATYLSVAGARLEAALGARAAVEAQLRIVIDELNHRTKNILAVVQAVVSRSLRDGGDPAAVRDAVSARIRAMASAATLLSQSEWRGIGLREMLAGSGLPYAERVRLEGEDVTLAPGAAQNVVLLVHELWTNAAKHGALSAEGGEAALSWRVEDRTFHLSWEERGGPPASLRQGKGFGRQLLERLAPQGLGGTGTLSVTPAGIRYDLRAPAERVLAPPGPVSPPAAAKPV